MAEIRTVALAGASGNLGSHTLKALLRTNFQVTVLTRSRKSATLDPAVRVIEVDYSSEESLTSALSGQDAVVSMLGASAIEGQKVLIDAAFAAGVKRFIPSEFGSCTTNPELQSLPMYSSFAAIRQHLEEKANAGILSYTILACGAFLDTILSTATLVNFDSHAAVLIDAGNNRLSATSLDKIGDAIAGILKHPKATSNRIVHVSEVILTQNNLIEIAKEIEAGQTWDLSTVQSHSLFQESLDAFAAGDFGMPSIMKLLTGTALAGDRYGSAYDETDNELLGIDILTRDELKSLISERLGESVNS